MDGISTVVTRRTATSAFSRAKCQRRRYNGLTSITATIDPRSTVACSALDAAYFHDQYAAFDYVERLVWPNGPVCPHCKAGFERAGVLKGMRTKASRKNPEGLERYGLYKCYACGKTFTVRAGTIFEHSHLALHLWLQVIHIMVGGKKDISTRQIQHMLNCSMKTAWFLIHRIREFMKAQEPGSAGGTRLSTTRGERRT